MFEVRSSHIDSSRWKQIPQLTHLIVVTPYRLEVEGLADLAVYSCTGKPKSTSAGTPHSVPWGYATRMMTVAAAGSTASEVGRCFIVLCPFSPAAGGFSERSD